MTFEYAYLPKETARLNNLNMTAFEQKQLNVIHRSTISIDSIDFID